MTDSWTKQSPKGKTVTFTAEGDGKTGFGYSAKMDDHDIMEIDGSLKALTRLQLEALFADYIAGK